LGLLGREAEFKAAMLTYAPLGIAKWPLPKSNKKKNRRNKDLQKALKILLPDLPDFTQYGVDEYGDDPAFAANGYLTIAEKKEEVRNKKRDLKFPKKETCGPSCHSCSYAVTGTPYRKGSKNFHIECFTCNFCYEAYTFRRKFVLPNGFHVSCSPCIGCCRPFDHQSKSGYCSTRCASKAPIIDIVAISAKRKGIYIPKNLLKEIYKFLYKLVAVEIQSLSEETLSIIYQAERRHGVH
jgi:hypothetical protein